MRILILAIAMIFTTNLFAQVDDNGGLFVRVFDLSGEKIAKGKIEKLTDQKIVLKTKKLEMSVPANNIGAIKTGKSGGTNVTIGAGVGASVGVVLGIAASEDGGLLGATTTGDNVGAMSILGGVLGSAAGGLSTLFKKSQKFQIDGDITRWQEFVNAMNR